VSRSRVSAKICGLRDPAAVEAAVLGGARHVGFVFFPRSPRTVDPETAGDLAAPLPDDVTATGVFVDPDDALLQSVLDCAPLGLLQLHGRESPERVAAVRAKFDVPVMKAVPVAGPDDLDAAERYFAVADRLLFDAKPPPDAALPGGNGLVLDWMLLRDFACPLPWMLSGGLTPGNVAEAIATSGALEVDVSSGVEQAPGRKSPALIRTFLEKVASL